MSTKYCGFVTIVGRPNVGKSTLLNRMIGKKLSITCHKPQTTRLNLYGIQTKENRQAVFIDTPGLHLNAKTTLNRLMNKQARSTLIDVDVVLFMVEANRWTQEDAHVASLISHHQHVLLLINKIDKVKEKASLLPFIEQVHQHCPQAKIVPVSAYEGTQVDEVMDMVFANLPESPFYFPEDMTCSRNDQYHMTEIIREKILRTIDQEVPYSATVQIEHLKPRDALLEVHALIWVEREGQKKIIIGPKGEKLKTIGIQARKDIEALIGKKVHLKLWVKVKKGWSDNAHALTQLGFEAT